MQAGRFFATIYEYKFTWRENVTKPKGKIELIGLKEVLFNKNYKSKYNHNWFYSLYDKEGNIIGTQWLPADENYSGLGDNIQYNFLQIENVNDS